MTSAKEGKLGGENMLMTSAKEGKLGGENMRISDASYEIV
jgi:hypothetical protein